jgi:hypothetical protein
MTLRDLPSPSPPPTRRKVLAALGTIGVVSVGAGLGSGANFSDVEGLAGGTDGGLMDLRIDYRTEFEGAVREVPSDRDDLDCTSRGLVDGDAAPVFDLDAIDPGDSGRAEFCLHVCDNRAYLWLQACLLETAENGQSYPEALVDDTSGTNQGELQDYVEVEIWYDHDGDGERDADEGYVYRGSLAGLDAAACRGVPLDGVGFFPDDEAGACTELVKFEDLAGELFETYEYPDGDAAVAAPVPYATYDPDAPDDDGHVYTVVAPDGGEVDLRFHDYAYENGDLVGVRITVLPDDENDAATTEYGLCAVRVKSGGGRDAVEEYTPDCTRSEMVYSPRSGRANVERQEISHITVSVCERTDPPEGVCFDPESYCLGVRWSFPADTAEINAVQGDSARFSMSFGAVQCRHNMANVNPFDGSSGEVT